MTSRRVYVEHLRGVPLFSGLTRKELETVAATAQEISRPAGTVLMKEGARGREAVIVLEGTLIVRRKGRRIAALGVGDIAGEMALLDDMERSATVECETACRVLVLTGPELRATMDTIPALSHKLMAALAGRVRELDRHLLG